MSASPARPDNGRGEPPPGVVCAFAPPGPGRHAVVAWARRHAGRTGARVEILVDPEPAAGPAGGGPLTALVDLVGDLLVRALGVRPGRTSLVDRVGRAAAGTRMLVVPQALPGVAELADTAYEPVTVVPDQAPHAGGPVVLALAPRTTDEVVDAAFDAAAHRGVPLLALRLRDTGSALRLPGDDAAVVDDDHRHWTEHLAAWRIAHPEVPVEVRVADGDPALELVDLSDRARLLVLGRSARGRLQAAVTPSPVPRVIRETRCPVLVVPPAGPPRRAWFSRR